MLVALAASGFLRKIQVEGNDLKESDEAWPENIITSASPWESQLLEESIAESKTARDIYERLVEGDATTSAMTSADAGGSSVTHWRCSADWTRRWRSFRPPREIRAALVREGGATTFVTNWPGRT